MTSKADLKHENEKTRDVKEREENVKDAAKGAVDDVKQGARDLANKTENLDIKDAPDRLLPSASQIDSKLEKAQDKLEEARHSKLGEKDLSRYPKIQQIFKDTQNVIQDNRDLLAKAADDDTLKNTAQHAASLASIIQEQTSLSVDKLWTNWASLLSVVAGAGAGSWKQILSESGNLLGQLKNTQDFIKILGDLQRIAQNIAARALQKQPVGQQLDAANKEWEQTRDQLLEDWKKVIAVLNESPMWKQLVLKGKALGSTVAKVGDDTLEVAQDAADQVVESEEVSKMKEDFKGVLQLIVGKDGPKVDAFLDYCQAAYHDIIQNAEFSKLASEMSDMFTAMDKSSGTQADYEKQFEDMHKHTKELLDNTVQNQNLRLALRESKKLIRSAKKDPATAKLFDDGAKLLTHLTDKNGVNLMDPQLLNEIRSVIVPLVLEHFDNAPLPDYHGRDANALGKYEFHLREMRLGATGLVPSKVKVEFRYKAVADPSKLKVKRQRMLMYLEASDMQVAFKDVKWEYSRLTIPRISDKGTVDLATAGKGITLRLKAEMHDYQAPAHAASLSDLLSEPKEHKMISLIRAECEIDDFHVRISDAGGANVFYEMLAGIWGTKVKHQIEHLVEDKMQLLVNKFNGELYEIVKRATQPSLADETKDALLSAGKTVGSAVIDKASDLKEKLQS